MTFMSGRDGYTSGLWDRGELSYICFCLETTRVRCQGRVTGWLFGYECEHSLLGNFLSSSDRNTFSLLLELIIVQDEPDLAIVCGDRMEHGEHSRITELDRFLDYLHNYSSVKRYHPPIIPSF